MQIKLKNKNTEESDWKIDPGQNTAEKAAATSEKNRWWRWKKASSSSCRW
jgi:hypothetical protein